MHLSYPPQLPISERRDEIVAAIAAHRVLIIVGDTGSGKTTQLPKMCLEAGRGTAGMIGCTQPRRIAAISVADRVAEEVRDPARVGYKIRFHDQTGESTVIKFMTDGVLLAETRQDQLLSRYDTIIVDEAHERSLNIDFLLGILKDLLSRRPDLNLLISSATIDVDKFSRHFGDAPVISVAGRTYPITTRHQEQGDQDDDEGTYVEQAVAAVQELALEPLGGDILVFMPTERDINDTLDGLQNLADRHLLLPLFGRLPAAEQRKIFRPSNRRKIVIATNVAETSVTVPGIRYVIDTGLARIARYNPRTGTTSLKVSRISQASCEQRRGRCGRTGPGTCIRLYSQEDFQSREPFTAPEIQRANLAEVILQMISLGLGDPAGFPFIDPPPGPAIREGYRMLRELGAITDENHLTANGRLMARLPLDPRISRIIIEGLALGAGREITILAAALSIQDPRIRPPDKEHKADEAHRGFIDKRSDFLTLLNIWRAFFDSGEPPSKSRLSRFCKSSFLSWQRMREWMDVHEQISRLLNEHHSVPRPSEPADYASVHQALTSGFLRNICLKKEKNIYIAAGSREVVLFPGSGLYNKGPQWAVASEFVETTQLFARTVAAIEVDWLERLGGTLCKRSWSEPHWEKKSGRVLALERVSLFGLTIVAGRKVEYGRINEQTMTEAREIFIREALVGNQLGGRYPFLDHNVDLVARFQEMEERLRRRDIVVDEEALVQFYDQRLGRIYDRFTLNRLLRNKKNDHFLRMSSEDICLTASLNSELYRFPETLRAGEFELQLDYRFEPGDPADGVTVRIPRDLLAHLNPQVFEWLVPGLLPEKLLLLCRRLPKQLRRRLVPLPDMVDRIMDSLDFGRGSLYQELERALLRSYQVSVQRADWLADALPEYLRMRFVLLDEEGRELTVSRSFDDLLSFQPNLADRRAGKAAADLPGPRVITAEDLDSIEPRLSVTDSGGRVVGLYFPALEADQERNTLTLTYVSDEEESRGLTRLGLQLLYGREFAKEMGVLRRMCKEAVTSHSASWLSLGTRAGAAELRGRLLALLLDAVFQTREGELPDQRHFAATMEQVRQQGLLRIASPVLAQVLAILTQRRAVKSQISQWAERARKSRSFDTIRYEEYLRTLEEIVPEHFLTSHPPHGLQHKVRYLQALGLRIERAEHAPHKDEKKAERLREPLARLSRLAGFSRPSLPCRLCRDQYLELLEEFRVSIFAPELGTSQPVSEQRLLQKWQEVENTCRRVE